MGETRDDSMSSEENVRKVMRLSRLSSPGIQPCPVSERSDWHGIHFCFQNLIEVIPDNPVTEESTEAPLVDDPTNEPNTTDSSESDETSETSESSESSEMGQAKSVDCVNSTESCESDEYFFQGIGDDGLYTLDNLMAPDESEREFQLRRWSTSMNWTAQIRTCLKTSWWHICCYPLSGCCNHVPYFPVHVAG